MISSHFLSLPTELRYQIYAYLYYGERICLEDNDSSHDSSLKRTTASSSSITRTCPSDDAKPNPDPPTSRRQNHIPPLFLTSHLIAQESRPIYFSSLTLQCTLQGRSSPPQLSRYLTSIGESSIRLLRHFRFRWDNYVEISIDLTATPLPKAWEQSAVQTTVYAPKCVMPAMGFEVCDLRVEKEKEVCENCKIYSSSSTPADAAASFSDGNSAVACQGDDLDGRVDRMPPPACISPVSLDEGAAAEEISRRRSEARPSALIPSESTTPENSSNDVEEISIPIPPPPPSSKEISHPSSALLPSPARISLPLFSPPKSIRVLPHHRISVSGIMDDPGPLPNGDTAARIPTATAAAAQHDLWRAMDTPAFCDHLSAALGTCLEKKFPRRDSAATTTVTTATIERTGRTMSTPSAPPFLTSIEILEVAEAIGMLGSQLKWLFF
jgi:hypothetical protein